MSRTGLPPGDVREVRQRALAYISANGLTYAAAAQLVGLQPWQVRDFFGGPLNDAEEVAAALCDLPIGLVYLRARVAVG